MTTQKKGKIRAGIAYIEVVPVISQFADQIEEQLEEAYKKTSSKPAELPAPEIPEKDIDASAEKSGQKFSAKLGVAVVAGFAALKIGQMIGDHIDKGIEQTKIGNKVAVALALNPEQRAVIEESTKNLYTEGYGESFEDVSNTMQAIVGTMKDGRELTADELTQMGKDALNMANVFGVSADEIMKATQSALGSGLTKTWEESQSFILAGFQAFGSKGDEWLDVINEFSDDFERFGLTGPKAINFVRAGLDAGIMSVDKMGDALNELSINLDDVDKRENFIKMGIDIDTINAQIAKGGDEATQALLSVFESLRAAPGAGEVSNNSTLFSQLGWLDFSQTIEIVKKEGKIFEDELGKLLDEVAEGKGDDQRLKAFGLDPDVIRQSFRESGAAAKDELLNSLTLMEGEFGQFEGGMQLFSSIGEDWNAAFINMDFSDINTDLEGTIGNLEEMDELLGDNIDVSIDSMKRTFEQAFIDTLMPVLETINPILQATATWIRENETAAEILGWVIAGILVVAVISLTVGLWAMAAAAWAAVAPFLPIIGVILLVVAAVAALIAIIWVVSENWDAVAEYWGGVWDSIVEWWNNTMESIQNGAQAAIDWLTGIWQGFIGWFADIGESIGNWWDSLWGGGGSETIEVNYSAGSYPQMADGGTILATPGGTLVNVGEAGRDEVIMDRGKWNRLLDDLHAGNSAGSKTNNSNQSVTMNIYQSPGESPEDLVRKIREFFEMNQLGMGGFA